MNTVSLHPAMLPMSPLSAPTAESGPQQAEAAKKLAQDFESLFVSMLIKQMRQSSTEDGMFPGDSSDTLGGIFDMQMGQYIAQQGGIGLAESIEKAL